MKAESAKKLGGIEEALERARAIQKEQVEEMWQKVSRLEHAKTELEKKMSEQKCRFDKECENNRKKIDALQKSENKLSRELNNVKTGWSFRTGRVITFVPRKIRDWLKH